MLAYFFLLFMCVVLHEYGHALAARKFKIATRDIIISPIGGLARLESLPSKPKEELLVAVAGPMVNLVLLIVFITIHYFLPDSIQLPESYSDIRSIRIPSTAIGLMIVANALLFFFNLIPAYPMDGRRILKALLSYRYSKSKSTMIAASIGRVFAIAFIALGAYNRTIPFLLIGLFVYILATREFHLARQTNSAEEESILE